MGVKKESAGTGWRDFAGILLLAACLMSLLCLSSYDPRDIPLLHDPPNAQTATWIGPFGAWAAFLLFMTFGVASYVFPVGLLVIALLLLVRHEGAVWPKAIWLGALMTALACLVEIRPAWWLGLCQRLDIATAGGMLGYGLARQGLVGLVGEAGTLILGSALLAVALIFFFEISPLRVAQWVGAKSTAGYALYVAWRKSRMDRRELIEYEQREIQRHQRRLRKEALQSGGDEDDEEAGVEGAVSAPLPEAPPRASGEPPPEPKPAAPEPEAAPPPPPPPPPKPKLPRMVRPAPEKTAAPPPETAATLTSAVSLVYKLPPLSLLEPVPPANQREIHVGDLQTAGRILVETLQEFGIETQLTNYETGPVVTRYELLPAAGVRVERIAGLANNIALSMKAESVRVQAPIPGKGVVGIEVPNLKTTTVYLREVLESEGWLSGRAGLPLALGQDVGGRVIVSDLGDMPHMLIAGATGSGKTVCMNSLLAGLLMSRTPDQLRLMLVDPKIVEFSAYNNLPHLVVPVITDPKKVALGLRWAITEMENRYKIFARAGVRNIKAFNSRVLAKQPDLFADAAGAPPPPPEDNPVPDRMPYIVIVVDELADLMLVAQADIESSIARLAQLSRAVGIHMILATQRPSVNVITGTIKANFPARIAFQVAQKVDSRTILDANGADKLLGKGDMLFLPPGTSRLVRAQGCMTSDADVHAIADYWRAQGQPNYEVSIKEKIERKSADVPDMEEDDGLIESSIEIIRQTKRASTSSLQRRLRIGYTRAARIMDLLEERGIVGPAQGSDPREILIDLDGEIPQNEAEPEIPADEK